MTNNRYNSSSLNKSFESLNKLIELIESSLSIGLIKIDGDTVYVFSELWDRWDINERNSFSRNIMAYYKIKYADFNKNSIYIKSMETEIEFGIILTDLSELVENT